jgi:hypothetical protein
MRGIYMPHNFGKEVSLVLQAFSGASTLAAWFAENDETKEIMDKLGMTNPIHHDNLQWAMGEFCRLAIASRRLSRSPHRRTTFLENDERLFP